MNRPHYTDHKASALAEEVRLVVARALLAERIRASGATHLVIGSKQWTVASVIALLPRAPESELATLERALAKVTTRQAAPLATRAQARTPLPARTPARSRRPRRPVFDSVFVNKIIGWE